jgi:hypothetical protein
LIDAFFEEYPGVGIANNELPVLDLDIIVEKGVGRGVYTSNKSTPVQCDCGQPHRIEGGVGTRSRNCGDLDQALGEETQERALPQREPEFTPEYSFCKPLF